MKLPISGAARVFSSEEQRRVDMLQLNLSRYGTVDNTLVAVCDVHAI